VTDVVSVVRELCEIHVNDGIEFAPDSIRGEEIRLPDEYDGVRIRLDAHLAEARIPVQIDVAFGDAVVPAPVRETYPTLLDHAAPHVLVYPRETVVAEKLEAIVSLGVTNSRMKDFYDLHRISSTAAFNGATLARAIRATFKRRKTPMPDSEPLVLAQGFLAEPERMIQWAAFLRRGRLEAPRDVHKLMDDLRAFLLPVLAAAASGDPYDATWHPGGPWIKNG